ncbi:MAG: amidohydrolase family protein [Bacteroidales bacterium]|jgi:cytosine/adenosine deaminase-related metal-dependent hydrolase|nr:amidohydrolase family protein [Bacteroidales bacterium]
MRKIKAQYIFDGSRLHKLATLVVNEGGGIETILHNTTNETACEEFFNGIVCPGFVNAHCHLELSHYRNRIPQHEGLPQFIKNVVKLRGSLSGELEAMQAADGEMQQNGIVAVGDISNTDGSFSVKQHSSIYYHTFIELLDLFNSNSKEFEYGKKLFSTHFHTMPLSLTPHAPYTCSRKLIERIALHANEYKYPLSIHNQECEAENEMYRSNSGTLYEQMFAADSKNSETINAKLPFPQYGKTSLQTYSTWLPCNSHTLFVHNTHTTQADIDFLKHNYPDLNYSFVVCPQSNAYIAHEIPPFDVLLNNKLNVAIGTDSLASNSKLNIVSELLALQQAFPNVSLAELLTCSTRNGAQALGIQKQFGTFEKGKTPGVVLLEHIDFTNMRLQNNTTALRLI